MSDAKKEYYTFIESEDLHIPEYDNYIRELETAKSELAESLKKCIDNMFNPDTAYRSAVQNSAVKIRDKYQEGV